jgi:hypothetical protein
MREAARELDAEYLPPVRAGDVYRIALKRPHVIGIIDGYFQSVPPVRHKEILWAMREGIHVFGSASIGALRAAELSPFGMQGIGKIYQWYRNGTLEDDDEVAVAHGPSESGFRAASEAMVNIRQTLRRAERCAIISRRVGTMLETLAKELFYPDRNYRLLFENARKHGIAAIELAKLKSWLPQGRVDQKREDALSMLRTIRQQLGRGLKSKVVQYVFEHTAVWEVARTRAATPEDKNVASSPSSRLRKSHGITRDG